MLCRNSNNIQQQQPAQQPATTTIRCSLRKRKLQSANTWLYEAVEGLKGGKSSRSGRKARGKWGGNGGEVTTACGTSEAHLQPGAHQKGGYKFRPHSKFFLISTVFLRKIVINIILENLCFFFDRNGFGIFLFCF